jgi:hypothetical protein
MDAYVNPENNHLILIYENGQTVDTDITLQCENDIEKYLPPYPRVCLPKYRNSFMYNIQNIPGHFTINYTSSDNCDMGQLCEVRLIIFSQTEPPTDCTCPLDGYILYVNLSNGNVYVKEIDSDVYLYIGNTHIQTIGPTGLNVDNVVYTNDMIYTCFTNGTFIQTDSLYSPTGPTGPVDMYSGTGFFGQFDTPTTLEQTIDLLRQPYTFYPTFFGTGIGSSPDTTPAQDAVVLGNHNDLTGPNNANYAVAIGYYSGQMNQQSNAIAIGKTSGYNFQGTGSIAIGDGAGYTSQGMNSIALGVDSGSIHQQTSSVSIGYQAGLNTQGTGCVALGSFAGYTGQGQYSIAIGHQAGLIEQASDSIVLSAGEIPINNTIPNSCVVYPIRNVNGTASNRVYWDPTTYEMTYGTEPSSIRYKENVIDIPRRYIDSIFELRPVEFNFKNKNQKQIGLIAEQVDEIMPEVVIRNADSVVEGVDYQQLIAPMIEIIKQMKSSLTQIEYDANEILIKDLGSRLSKLEFKRF